MVLNWDQIPVKRLKVNVITYSKIKLIIIRIVKRKRWEKFRLESPCCCKEWQYRRSGEASQCCTEQ